MGRELRRVPPGWEHPRDGDGQYIPLHDQSYEAALADWHYANRLWEEGRHPDQAKYAEAQECASYEDWADPPPSPEYYRQRSWTEDEATCWQVYENITEGTPVSPVLPTLDDVRNWLLQDGYTPAAAEALLTTCYLPTFIGTIPNTVLFDNNRHS